MKQYLTETTAAIALIALAVSVIALTQTTAQTPEANQSTNENWVCSDVRCTEYLTGQEWIDEFCLEDGGQTVCPVQVQGEQRLVPLNELENQVNLDQFQQCIEARCVAESLTRTVNYSVEIEQGAALNQSNSLTS